MRTICYNCPVRVWGDHCEFKTSSKVWLVKTGEKLIAKEGL